MADEDLVDYLIRVDEAVEYGERWTEKTTYEWWYTNEAKTERECRLVATYHGGGNRGDDDEAEYIRRLLDQGRAVTSVDSDEVVREVTGPEITHVIRDGKAVRIRAYIHDTPEGLV